MRPLTELDSIERHALALTIWTPAGLIAVTLYHYGLGDGGASAIAGAFVAILAAFAGHIVINAVSRTTFTALELALALTATGAALVAFGAATLFSSAFASRAFLPTSCGFVALFTVFVLAMIIRSGLRPAFEAFDAIRSFSARDDQVGRDRRSGAT